jgi:hypothetical protein
MNSCRHADDVTQTNKAWMANTVNSANLKLYYKYVYCREEIFDLAVTLLMICLMLSIPLWYVSLT